MRITQDNASALQQLLGLPSERFPVGGTMTVGPSPNSSGFFTGGHTHTIVISDPAQQKYFHLFTRDNAVVIEDSPAANRPPYMVPVRGLEMVFNILHDNPDASAERLGVLLAEAASAVIKIPGDDSVAELEHRAIAGEKIPIINWPLVKQAIMKALELETWPKRILLYTTREQWAQSCANYVEFSLKGERNGPRFLLNLEGRHESSFSNPIGAGYDLIGATITQSEEDLAERYERLTRPFSSTDAMEGQKFLLERAEAKLNFLKSLSSDDPKNSSLVIFLYRQGAPEFTAASSRTRGDLTNNPKEIILTVGPQTIENPPSDKIPILNLDHIEGREIQSPPLHHGEELRRLITLLTPMRVTFSSEAPAWSLITAIRRIFVPNADILTQEDILYSSFKDPSMREECLRRWAEEPQETRQRVVRVMLGQIRPPKGKMDASGAEVFAKFVLNLTELDPSCLSPEDLDDTKKILVVFFQKKISEYLSSSERGAPSFTPGWMGDFVSEYPYFAPFQEELFPIYKFAAETAVEGYLNPHPDVARYLNPHPEARQNRLQKVWKILKKTGTAGVDIAALAKSIQSAAPDECLALEKPDEFNKVLSPLRLRVAEAKKMSLQRELDRIVGSEEFLRVYAEAQDLRILQSILGMGPVNKAETTTPPPQPPASLEDVPSPKVARLPRPLKAAFRKALHLLNARPNASTSRDVQLELRSLSIAYDKAVRTESSDALRRLREEIQRVIGIETTSLEERLRETEAEIERIQGERSRAIQGKIMSQNIIARKYDIIKSVREKLAIPHDGSEDLLLGLREMFDSLLRKFGIV